MKIEQVAVQLFTLRDFLKTPADVANSLRKVAEIGYKAVQVSGMGPIAEEELVKLCEENGLTLCATHEPSDSILNNPEAVVERLKKLNCKLTAYPFPKDVDFASEESIANLIKKLDHAGKVLADNGQILTYHNHHQEFRKLNGKVILERIYDETNPQYLQGEPDTYWVQYGGACPVAWCERLSGRLPMIHLKDYCVNSENNPTFCEIGAGNLDFKKIVAAAEKAGCEWFIVEQDSCPGDPFDSLRMSFDYIKANLVS